jgi:RNA polymerase sigma factor (sigma-70 family)
MASPLALLDRLLDRSVPAEQREEAWSAFVDQHALLLLHVARVVDGREDGGMDAFTFVLEKLREEDFRRLRQWQDDGRSQLSTWLVVVARRLCLDFVRHRDGRLRPVADPGVQVVAAIARRSIAGHLPAVGDPELLVDPAPSAERIVRASELTHALGDAVASLTIEERRLLRLRFEDELTGREIATAAGLPTPFHAFRRINAVLERLRARLAAMGVTDSRP